MDSLPPTRPGEAAESYHGFSLASVGWGYRDLFQRLIGDLLARGVLGPHRSEVTATFFGMLRQADQGSYDHVLRRFLGAINPRTEWLVDLPAVFADVVDLGRDYAAGQPHHGVVFFSLLAEGGLGHTPEQVRHALALARRLRVVDAELSLAFLGGYQRLADRLDPSGVERYVEAGLAVHVRDPRRGLAFMEGTLDSAEDLVRALAQECRLQDLHETLRGYVRGLAGQALEVTDLGHLPADALAERGAQCVLLGDTLYLPTRIRRFAERGPNRAWYLLAAAVAAGTLRFDGFSRVHGQPRYLTLGGLVGTDPVALNALLLAEWTRLLARSTAAWLGLRRLLHFGLEQELTGDGPWELPRRLLLEDGRGLPPALVELAASARQTVNVFHTAALLTDELRSELRRTCPGLADGVLPPLSFMPDALFPAPSNDAGPNDRLVADLKRAAEAAAQRDGLPAGVAQGEAAPLAGDDETPPPEPPAATDAAALTAAYVYDEWSLDEHAYRRGHCHVHVTVPSARQDVEWPADLAAEARRVRRAFERLKPETTGREKYLPAGDEINVDRLVHFAMQRGADPSPRVDFYEKPRINRRDVAVLVLLDVSGSTAEMNAGRERILEVERRAAMVLGQGLNALGDRFAICGFHSNGPRHCAFLVFKDFAERWDRGVMARLLAALPVNSTRIGPALRHAGWLLSQVACRQRLILLITDGRPMDTGYDPATRYAHHDVRKACEENARLGIHTFGVSTEENSSADMEFMFPGRRFAILSDIRQLPRLLPTLYARLTV